MISHGCNPWKNGRDESNREAVEYCI